MPTSMTSIVCILVTFGRRQRWAERAWALEAGSSRDSHNWHSGWRTAGPQETMKGRVFSQVAIEAECVVFYTSSCIHAPTPTTKPECLQNHQKKSTPPCSGSFTWNCYSFQDYLVTSCSLRGTCLPQFLTFSQPPARKRDIILPWIKVVYTSPFSIPIIST